MEKMYPVLVEYRKTTVAPTIDPRHQQPSQEEEEEEEEDEEDDEEEEDK